jgi:hypothetical protein
MIGGPAGLAIGAVGGGIIGGVAGIFGGMGRGADAEDKAKGQAAMIMGQGMSEAGRALQNQPVKFGSGGGTFASRRGLRLG